MKTVSSIWKTKYRPFIAVIYIVVFMMSLIPVSSVSAEDTPQTETQETTDNGEAATTDADDPEAAGAAVSDTDTNEADTADTETAGIGTTGSETTGTAGTDTTGSDTAETAGSETTGSDTTETAGSDTAAEAETTGSETSDTETSEPSADGQQTGSPASEDPSAGSSGQTTGGTVKSEPKLNFSSLELYIWQEDVISLSGADRSEDIRWSVSDGTVLSIRAKQQTESADSVAFVTGKSVVAKALKEGKAVVTAEYAGIKYICTIEVKKQVINYAYKLMNVGDKVTLKVKGATIVSFTSDNAEIASVSTSGKVTAKAAGSTTIILVDDNAEVYTCNLMIFDGDKLNNPYLTQRTVTDDLWLTTAIKAGETTYERSTGLKLVKKTKKGYKVSVGDQTFEISSSYVTTVCPAVTPTPAAAISDSGFKVEEGMLVNYTSNLMYSGTPKGLVYLRDTDITRNFSYDKSCRLQKEVIEPLSEMIDDAVAAGGTWFAVDETGAYRTFSLQDTYWKNRIAGTPTYGDDPYHNGGTKCVPAVSSEHRTGYAIDILTTDSSYKWLNENSYKYGFILRYTADKTKYTGVMDEYWHYTYVGKGVAYTCHAEGLCLEEYYMKYVDPTASMKFD